MKIKINEKLICIPPYISANWDQVTFLQSEDDDPSSQNMTLVVHLADGKEVRIPNLDHSLIEIAFSSHLKYLESQSGSKTKAEAKSVGGIFQQMTGLSPEQIANMPIRFGISGIPGVENIEMAFQHNPSQSEAPDMPKEVLEKVSMIAKMMSGGDLNAFPKPEPHCNCMHCQVARAIHGIEKNEEAQASEEKVPDEELQFRDWDIVQSGDKLYSVTNPLDSKETYRVYLGNPIGCTCGQAHCEHIKAVLYS